MEQYTDIGINSGKLNVHREILDTKNADAHKDRIEIANAGFNQFYA